MKELSASERQYVAWCRVCRCFGTDRRLLMDTDPEQFVCVKCDQEALRSYRTVLPQPKKKGK